MNELEKLNTANILAWDNYNNYKTFLAATHTNTIALQAVTDADTFAAAKKALNDLARATSAAFAIALETDRAAIAAKNTARDVANAGYAASQKIMRAQPKPPHNN